MNDARNRPGSKFSPDDWLTPPTLIETLAAGRPFHLDPACPPNMPWKTALLQFTKAEDGLSAPWPTGARVWLNPPYSGILPWARRLAAHRDAGGSGLFLVPAKSTDTVWGQFTLGAADAVLFMAGRILFWYPDGTESTGKWSPSMICAFGQWEAESLVKLWSTGAVPGVAMRQAL